MSAKNITQELYGHLSIILNGYAFYKPGKSASEWIRENNLGFDKLRLSRTHKAGTTTVTLSVERCVNSIEDIVREVMSENFFKFYRPDKNRVTFRFTAHNILVDKGLKKGGTTGVQSYNYPYPNYLIALNEIKKDLDSIIMPFLESIHNLEGIHEFINIPPQMFIERVYFFALDGCTIFRKMIVAKLVNKDYEAICKFVKNFIENEVIKDEEDMLQEYLQSFQAFKVYLNENINP